MCVIIVKPAGVKMPSKDVLKQAYYANPHGCGFVSEKRFFKSLNFSAFMSALAKVDTAEPCIIHFRLATHGSRHRKNCHPFYYRGIWFAHNGILDINPIGDMTDSETALRTIIGPVIEQYGIDSPQARSVINNVIGYSKFAFLNDDNTLRLFGNFTEGDDGCYYSNFNFKRFAFICNKPLACAF